MSIRRVRVGMIGGGLNSAVGRVHEIALKMDNRYELVAGCFSRNRETNYETASAYNVNRNRVYLSGEALIEREHENIDAIVIATPMDSHYLFIKLALAHGLKVITDKPVVARLADSYCLMQRPIHEQNSVFCIFNYTGYPMVREMRQLIKQGILGKVFRVMIEMPQDSYIRLMNSGNTKAIQGWRLVDGDIPCVTLDLFVHLHSLVKFICGGKAVQVDAHSHSITQVSPNLIDEVDTHIRLDNGILVNAWYGKASLGYRNGLKIRIFGTHGSCEWVQSDPESLTIVDSFGRKQINDRLTPESLEVSNGRYQRFKAGHPAGFIEAFANYYFDIADCIIFNKESEKVMPLSVAHEGLVVSHAIHQGISIDRILSNRLCSLNNSLIDTQLAN